MKQQLCLIIIIGLSLTCAANGMADTHQPVDSTQNTSQPQDIMQQKYLDLVATQKKALQEIDEKSLKALESDEKLHEEQATSHEKYIKMQDEAEKTHEKYAKMQDEAEKTQERNTKLED